MTHLATITLSDLKQAQLLAARIGDEIDPQFRCATPTGDWWIAITFPDVQAERARVLGLVSDWMAVNQVAAFTMAAELAEPMALMCVGVSFTETLAVTAQILSRSPYTFGPPVWMSREQIGDDVPRLLPRGARSLGEDRLVQIEAMFGGGGPFEALRLPS